MLLDEAMSAPLLDRTRIDLDAADTITYRLRQTFRYDYDEPVQAVRQRLVIIPPQRHGDAHLRHHSFEVSGASAHQRVGLDSAGNTVVDVHAARVEHHIEFSLSAVVERLAGEGDPALPAAALSDPKLLEPTPLTRPDDRLRDWADDLRRLGEPTAVTAERVCAAVHSAMVYEGGVTTERTTAAASLAGGRGVCQDFAHVMLSLCRLLDVPARYVSGHLLGQGGTHAWVEVVVPHGDAARALALDPCNGKRCAQGHLTVATGRDYADVAPTAGTYVGAPTGRLSTSRSLGVVGLH